MTNAAMLLFGRDPEKWQLGAYIKIGYFETDSDLKYQDEVHGSVLEQVDKAIELVYLKYMKAKITYEGIQRIEHYFVPEDALREAILNAIAIRNTSLVFPFKLAYTKTSFTLPTAGGFLKIGRWKT